MRDLVTLLVPLMYAIAWLFQWHYGVALLPGNSVIVERESQPVPFWISLGIQATLGLCIAVWKLVA